MIPLSAEEAGEALDLAPLVAGVPGVSVDSRSIRPGDLFVALRGEHFDGHDFVGAAFQAGASGAVVESGARVGRGTEEGPGPSRPGDVRPVYEVNDSLEALWGLARAVRRKSGAVVFAITGSAGKTSTKDLLGAMVGRVSRVVSTPANQNNEIGVPLTLFATQPDTQALIVEMGMRGRGQIAALARVAEPDIGVITNIHPVHLELLGTLEGIAEAKAELLHGLRKGGVAVLPADCAILRPHVEAAGCRVVTCGLEPEALDADVSGSIATRAGGAGSVLTVRWPGAAAEIEIPAMSRHAAANVVTAVAACYAAGLPVEECLGGVNSVRFTGGRGDILDLPGLCVIDDTYNANPAAVRAALDNLARVATETGGRPVAVLGDMLELGPETERFHREVGAYAADVGVRALWGVGELARVIVEGFRERWERQPQMDADWAGGQVGSAEETSLVTAGLRVGDVVLFKASRGVRLETMVRRVIEEADGGRWGSSVNSTQGRGADSGYRDATKEKR